MNAPRSGSSHYTFRKQGRMPITIPKHEPIKKVYVEMLSAFSPIAEQRGHGTKTHMHITSFADLYSIIVAQKL